MALFSCVCVVLICFGHTWAKPEDAYFVLGKTLLLRPADGSYTPPITNVEWRHDGNIAIEWSRQSDKVDIYRNFKNRASLNVSTGVLKIIDMSENEAGLYTVEINSVRSDVQYTAKAIEEVQKPKLWVKPGVEFKEGERDLVCQGDVSKAGPVTYWWDKDGNGTWVEFGDRIVIMKNETTKEVETFSCKIRNPVSEEASEPEGNPFYTPEQTGNPALGALALIPLAAAAVVFGVMAYRGWFKKVCGSGVDTVSPENRGGTEDMNLRDTNGDAATTPADEKP